jgi:hypothetical protein
MTPEPTITPEWASELAHLQIPWKDIPQAIAPRSRLMEWQVLPGFVVQVQTYMLQGADGWESSLTILIGTARFHSTADNARLWWMIPQLEEIRRVLR